MKKLLIFTLLVGCLFKGFSQNTDYYNRMHHIFGTIDKTKVTTGYLKEFGIRYTGIEGYNGILDTYNFADKTQWQLLYSSLHSMRVGTVAQGMAAPNTVFANLKTQQAASADVLLATQFYNYQQYKTTAYTGGDVTVSNYSIYDVAGRNPYDTKTAFAAAPLKQELTGDTFSFKLPSSLIYTNTGLTLTQAEVDFGNGIGYQTVSLNTSVPVTYTSGGEKEIKVKFTYSGGLILYSHSKILVNYMPSNPNPQARFDGMGISNHFITGSAWQGSASTGIVTVELAPGHSQLTKPLIVVEGFDPENTFDYTDLVSDAFYVGPGGLNIVIDQATNLTLNQAIENEGYDLVFVNFTNSTDYIQRNAYMVKAVINWVNAQKAAAGSTEKNVVLGMSMGGLVARYALRNIEQTGGVHDTKLYISHDAPHQGANVPVAFQALVRHLVGESISLPVFFSTFNVNVFDLGDNFPDLEDGLNLLETPAAQQMLIYQLQGTGTGISVPANTLRDSFATEYKNMGYPQNEGIRNIAIANGSECGNTLGYNPYADFLAADVEVDINNFIANVALAVINGLSFNPEHAFWSLLAHDTDLKAQFYVRALPNSQSRQIYKGRLYIKKKILFWTEVTDLIDEGSFYSTTSMLPLDNSGGGVYDLEAFAQLPDLATDFLLQRRFNFIPTYSSLDIGGGNQAINYSDLTKTYSPLSPPLSPKNTPFHNFYTNPVTSEGHIQFTLKNGNWLMDELDSDPTSAFYSCVSDCGDTKLPLLIWGGTDQICFGNPTTYELKNLNLNANATVTWSVFPGGAVSSITVNGNFVTISPSGNFNGVASLIASISTNCGVKEISRGIYMGAYRPRLYNIMDEEIFHIEACTKKYFNFKFSAPQSVLEWEWRKISGNYSLVNISNGNGTIYSALPASGIFDVRVRDACGWGPRTMITVNVTNCPGPIQPMFVAYPNPASDVITIEESNAANMAESNEIMQADPNFDYSDVMDDLTATPSSATLYDFTGNPVATISPADGTIDVQSFPPGFYILVITKGDETESHHIVIE